jgi:paraquat-inducible protein B
MSRQASKSLIGVFVIGAVALMVAGLVIFGGGKFFTPKVTYVMFFEGSVKGLNVGAPVVFQGVKLGTVKDILLVFDPETLQVRIPVYAELEPKRVTLAVAGYKRAPGRNMAKLIEQGMRARLQMQSLVTGLLMVELDFHPNTPINLVGADPDYPELPTIPSVMGELAKTLDKVPFDQLANTVMSSLNAVQQLLTDPKLPDILTEVDASMQEVTEILTHISDHLDPIYADFHETMQAAKDVLQDVDQQIEPLSSTAQVTLKDASKLMRDVDTQVEPLSTDVQQLAKAATTALEEAEKTLAAIEVMANEDSPTNQQLTSALRELSGTLRSVRVLADYIKQHPESFIRGRGASGGR